MSPKNLTLTGAALVAMLAVGCSNSHKVLNPIQGDDSQLTATQATHEDGALTRPAPSQETYFGFRATLHRIELEGGCWYLETAKGERYEPRFQKEPEVKYDRMELDVYGYADYRTPTYCMIGPIFRVEKFQILSKGPVDEPGVITPIEAAKPQIVEQLNTPPTPIITVIGRIHWPSKEGDCVYLETGDDLNFELRFLQPTFPPINPDVKVKVTGRIIPKEISECVAGPVFQVHKVQNANVEDRLTKSVKNHPRYEMAESSPAADPQPIVDHPNVGFLRLQGSYNYTKDGCAFIATKDRGQVALAFDNQVCPNIPAGALVEVGGSFSLLTVSPCGLGNLFNALYITRLDNNDRVKAEEAMEMPN